MLLPRLLTALVGLPLVVLAVWWGQWPYLVLVFAIAMLALYEFYALVRVAGWPVSPKLGLSLGAVLCLAMAIFGVQLSLPMEWDVVLWAGAERSGLLLPAIGTGIGVVMAAAMLLRRSIENAFLDFALTLSGIFFVAWSLSHLFLIRDVRPHGMHYTFFLLIIVWTLDIGAYFTGKKWGRRALAPIVSPKKTWEGAIGGTALGLLSAAVCRLTFLRFQTMPETLSLALGVLVLAQLSDLVESLFKRNVGVKDSGALLPGHGGILDRFDSFLLSAPIYYYALAIFFAR